MFTSELSDSDFRKISHLVFMQSGIHLHDGKKELVNARLGKRLREGNFRSFSDYYRYVTTKEGSDELVTMIDSISTNLTYFFREESHFRKLRDLISKMVEANHRQDRPTRLRIWSAGCSTGEEPYSLAMTIRECDIRGCIDATIIATDISTKVLKAALSGIFDQGKLKKLSPVIQKKYFQVGTGQSQGNYRIKSEIREMVRFERFNLMDLPPSYYVFDIVFCRNVMIYFDKATQSSLVNRFYDCLNKGGYFFVGHSESLTGLSHPFKYIEPSVYGK